MATTKKSEAKTETIVINPIDTREVEITIVGRSPLIVHAWSEKAKKEMLDGQQGKKVGKQREFKNPVKDFIESMYWLDGIPKIPEGATEEDCVKIFDDAVAKGARFGFPAVAIKAAAAGAAYRQKITTSMTQPNGAFYVWGIDDPEMVEIEGDTPIMREDMVRIAGGKADIRYRGEFRNWKIRCKVEYLTNGVFSLESILNMINLGGFCCGLGEWRAEKGGLSGAYRIETSDITK